MFKVFTKALVSSRCTRLVVVAALEAQRLIALDDVNVELWLALHLAQIDVVVALVDLWVLLRVDSVINVEFNCDSAKKNMQHNYF